MTPESFLQGKTNAFSPNYGQREDELTGFTISAIVSCKIEGPLEENNQNKAMRPGDALPACQPDSAVCIKTL